MVAKGYCVEQTVGCVIAALFWVLSAYQLCMLILNVRKGNRKETGVVKKIGIPVHLAGATVLLVRAVDPQAVLVYPLSLSQTLGLLYTALAICWLQTYLYSFMFAQYLIAHHRAPEGMWKPLVWTSSFLVLALAILDILALTRDQELWHSLTYFCISLTILALAGFTILAVRELTKVITSDERGGTPSPELEKQLTVIHRFEAFIVLGIIAASGYYFYTGSLGLTTAPLSRANPEKYQPRASSFFQFITIMIMIPFSWIPRKSLERDSSGGSNSSNNAGNGQSAPSVKSPRHNNKKKKQQETQQQEWPTAASVAPTPPGSPDVHTRLVEITTPETLVLTSVQVQVQEVVASTNTV